MRIPGWLRGLLPAALLILSTAGTASAQQHLWPGTEELPGIGLRYTYAEIPTYLLDHEMAEADQNLAGFDRHRSMRRTEIGMNFLLSDRSVSAFISPSYTFLVDQSGQAHDWAASLNFGISLTLWRFEFSATDLMDDPMKPDRVPRTAPALWVGIGASAAGFIGQVTDNATGMDVNNYGGEISGFIHVGVEIIEHLNLWVFPSVNYGYENDDGDIVTGTTIDRIYELDNVMGFGVGASYRAGDALFMVEGHFLATTSFTFTFAWLFQ